MFIKEAIPRVIRNSRGERTIEISLKTFEGKFTSSAPSGKSKGKSEVQSYNKDGIYKSLKLLRIFCAKIKNKNFIIKKITDLKKITDPLHKFESRRGRLGGNVSYALETVFLKAAAADNGKELWQLINDDVNDGLKPKMPMPVGNCVGGGLHSKPVKGKEPDFQEFLLIPKEKTFSKAITKNLRAYQFTKSILKKRAGRNDENAWRTGLTNEEVLDTLKRVSAKYKVRLGLDIAASTFYEKGYYKYKNKELIRDKTDQSDYVEKLIKKYKLFYVEDPMQEEDFSSFQKINNSVEKSTRKTLIVGDDLTTTNMKLVRRAQNSKSINAMIIKPNQIGSILEVKKVVEFCKKNNITMIFSHRSGETMDDALADYCVGFGGQFMKAGIFGKERLIKLKRVVDIEKSLK